MVVKDKERALLGRQTPKATFELVALGDGRRLVRVPRTVGRKSTDMRLPAASPARLHVADTNQESPRPGFESVRIAERRQLTPGDHQRLLHGVLGPIEVPEDPV